MVFLYVERHISGYTLLGEMIVFNRSLSNEDRKEIEKYLGKKWGIKVNYGQ